MHGASFRYHHPWFFAALTWVAATIVCLVLSTIVNAFVVTLANAAGLSNRLCTIVWVVMMLLSLLVIVAGLRVRDLFAQRPSIKAYLRRYCSKHQDLDYLFRKLDDMSEQTSVECELHFLKYRKTAHSCKRITLESRSVTPRNLLVARQPRNPYWVAILTLTTPDTYYPEDPRFAKREHFCFICSRVKSNPWHTKWGPHGMFASRWEVNNSDTGKEHTCEGRLDEYDVFLKALLLVSHGV